MMHEAVPYLFFIFFYTPSGQISSFEDHLGDCREHQNGNPRNNHGNCSEWEHLLSSGVIKPRVVDDSGHMDGRFSSWKKIHIKLVISITRNYYQYTRERANQYATRKLNILHWPNCKTFKPYKNLIKLLML